MCTVALIIVLVSKFYKDIVQILILYKLITVLFYYLGLLIIIIRAAGIAGGSKYILEILVAVHGSIFYCAHSVLTFWLTIILYLCIVHLKELENLKKLEPAVIITSCIPFLFIASIFQLESKNTSEKVEPYSLTALHSIVGLLSIIISILMIIIIIKVLMRSFRRQKKYYHTNQNKWRMLSKQLLPLVVYPIVDTIGAVISFTIYYSASFDECLPFSLIMTSLGPITSTLVILHLCLLKCKKCKKKQ